MKLIKFFRSLFHRIASRRNRRQQQKSPKDPVKLNQLPDLCLLAIFTRLPQADLITVGRVCTRWKSLVLVVSNKITSLTIRIENYGNSNGIWTRFIHPYTELLVQNDDDQAIQCITYDRKKYTKWNLLRFTCSQFNLSLVKKITNTFPAITLLELCYSDLSSAKSLKPIAHLLSHYHSQLISIKLKCGSKVKQLDYSPLLVSINQMPSPLRTLLLDLNYNACLSDPEPLPIISQLKQFFLDLNLSILDKEQMASIRRAIAENENLRQVGLRLDGDFELAIAPLENEFHARITHLIKPYSSYYSKPQYMIRSTLSTYCIHYPSITKVKVELYAFQYLDVLRELSTLRHLIHLKVKIYFGSQEPEDPLVLLQLPSVKTIKFDLRNTKSFENFAFLRFPYHFPEAQVIQMMFYGRTDLQPSYSDQVAIYDHLKTECPRLHHLYEGSKLVWCR